MPGGRSRQHGVKGRRYPNRTDLQNGFRPEVAAGQAYGERKRQEDMLQAMPMGSPPAPSGSGGGGAAPGATSFPLPGSLGALDRPTDRPNEPLTAGAPFGPGPGPEALGLPQPDGVDPDLAALARQLPVLELLANQPTSSIATRNFVRRLQGMIPANFEQPDELSRWAQTPPPPPRRS